MNTPAHLIIGAAAFARPGRRAVTLAAVLGALAPDLSLYVMAGVSLFILNIEPEIVFDQLYFSPAWQQVFAIDNSFVVWGAALAAGLALRRDWLIAFSGAALLHLAFDFPLHHDDARAHFWPLTNWVFESPISYWDTAHFAGIVAPLEMLLCIGLSVVLWRRFVTLSARVLITFVALLEVAPFVMWAFIFEG